jgi:PAS domain S-box-containing protein
MATTVSWAVYGEVKGSALDTVRERLSYSTQQVAGMLQSSVMQVRQQAVALAARPEIVAYLAGPSPAARRIATAILDSVLRQAPGNISVELWLPYTPLLWRGPRGAPIDSDRVRSLMSRLGSDSVTVGPFRLLHDSLFYESLAPVRSRQTTVGYFVHQRRAAGSPRQVQALIGANASIFVGNVQGDGWSDLTLPVAPPPVRISGSGEGLLEYDRGGGRWQLASAAAIPSTPWVVLVELPRSPVLAGARRVLQRMGLILVGLLALGGGGAWALSRSLTGPLAELGSASGAIAGGDYSRRLAVRRRDELGQLAQAFNTMAGGVQASMTELAAASAHTRTILENIADGVLVLDRQGRHLDANPRACAITGYSMDELLQLTTADTYPPKDRPAAAARLAQVTARQNVSVEREMLRKDGSVITIQSDARLLPDGRLLATIRDVTQQRQLERQFLQAQKMEAVGRLAGGVAHDFNNLLTAITGYAALMREDMPPGDPRCADLDEILHASDRAAGLTRQLLAFSRRQVVQPRVLDLNEVVTAMEKLLRRIIGEDVRLETLLAPEVAGVSADTGQIEQVIVNLAVNARDAMPGGGRLTIETSTVELDPSYTAAHTGVEPGQYVLLAISDTGTGMSADIQSRIFEPFFTTKDPGKGTGLGLATVYGIVKQSEGHVNVYSELGHGTTFKVYLPAVAERGEKIAVRRGEARTRGGTETVLLVEDEEGVRKLAREVLERHGYTVLQARDGAEALDVGRAHAGPVHLMVTDVVMPTMGGPESAERLRTERPDMRVLYVSGYTDRALTGKHVLSPGVPYLQKPFGPAALARRVREVLDGA